MHRILLLHFVVCLYVRQICLLFYSDKLLANRKPMFTADVSVS